MLRALTTATLALLSVGASTACSGGANAVPLQANRPGVQQYRVECNKDIERCREKASSVCAGSYEILQSSGHSVDPERITTAPGPVSTGPNFPRPSWVGELIIECGRRPPAREPIAGAMDTGIAPATSAAPASAAMPALAPGTVCVPGATQLCLGPAACRGAQACLEDGRGFGVCDCGAAANAAPEPAAPRAAGDAGATLPQQD